MSLAAARIFFIHVVPSGESVAIFIVAACDDAENKKRLIKSKRVNVNFIVIPYTNDLNQAVNFTTFDSLKKNWDLEVVFTACQ